MGDGQEILQYIPMKSFVHPSFWYKLAEIKLNIDKLSDAPRKIFGYYTNYNSDDCLLEVDYSAFNSEFVPQKNCFMALGTLYNKNTIEEFKNCDKVALLAEAGEKMLSDIKNGTILDDAKYLFRFIILSFADLKTHKYYYWFAFPVPMEPIVQISQGFKTKRLSDLEDIVNNIENFYNTLPNNENKCFFMLEKNAKSCLNYLSLNEGIAKLRLKENVPNLENIYFCFADPCHLDRPSWLLRSYMCLIYYKCNVLRGQRIKVIGIRINSPKSLERSLVWELIIPESISQSPVKFVGWECNVNGKMGPRCAAMADNMDPDKLADSAINLNLKLMKWRVLPELDLDQIKKTKCLLFGAGTLGCAVARNLMAWGFKNITFVDNGHVSLSNPARQSLYKHEDAINVPKMKAIIAAERLKDINPNAVSHGYCLQVPMPGHTVGEAMHKSVSESLDVIEEQVKSHDVLFLLTDSRESRWLPALLGAFHKKIVINAALGFDSYLIMRHGSKKPLSDDYIVSDVHGLHCIPGSDLGCYFCNDITAPGDSTKDRTLDQQCTVTRPGVSNIAASYAVELLVSLLQHKYKELAPAYFCARPQEDIHIPEGVLGIIPHSIRGNVGTFENILPATSKFSQCIACSEKVINEFGSRGKEFLFQVFASAKYLEDLTEISKLGEYTDQILEYDDKDGWSD